jgi:phosphomannomutase/phosphoglucomutase
VVFDVKCSQVLVDDIRSHGGQPVMWKTGHSHLKRKMREDGILLGGEVSGHMFFGENWYGVDDGILARASSSSWWRGAGGPVSALFEHAAPPRRHPELKAPCADDRKFPLVEELAREFRARYQTVEIDGVRIIFPEGWGLVRASNTNPYLTSASRRDRKPRTRCDDGGGLRGATPLPYVTLPA